LGQDARTNKLLFFSVIVRPSVFFLFVDIFNGNQLIRLNYLIYTWRFHKRKAIHAKLANIFEQGYFYGKRWDVRLDFVRQFKNELVRRLEGLVFEKKSILLWLG
jgi:hypothetical protein